MRIYWFFIWANLDPLHPRMFCAKIGWNWLSGSGEEDFLILSMYFRYFVIISAWKRVEPLIWTNLNPLHPRMHWAKFGWNWPNGSGEEDFLFLPMYYHYFVIISPWKRTGPFIWTNLNPLHPRMFCAKFGWNRPSGSGEEDENVKSLQMSDGQTDDRQQVIRKAHLSFQLRWANKINIWWNVYFNRWDDHVWQHIFCYILT